MSEPEYYNMNGLSPLEAFKHGLISRDECLGFIKGNIIKYVVRCDKKGEWLDDVQKAHDYIYELYCLLGSEELDVDVGLFKRISELVRDIDD